MGQRRVSTWAEFSTSKGTRKGLEDVRGSLRPTLYVAYYVTHNIMAIQVETVSLIRFAGHASVLPDPLGLTFERSGGGQGHGLGPFLALGLSAPTLIEVDHMPTRCSPQRAKARARSGQPAARTRSVLWLLGPLLVACGAETTPAADSTPPADADPPFVREEAGDASTERGVSRGAAWGDFDGDGDPDLFVTRPTPDGAEPRQNALFRNDGGRLVLVESNLLDTPPGGWQGATWVDVDGDGDLDLHVVGRGGAGSVFVENRDGSLEVRPDDPFSGAVTSASMTCWADADGDGWLDVFMVGHGEGRNHLFRNRGAWRMEDIEIDSAARGEGRSRACVWVHLEGSSEPALVVANARTPNLLLRNEGEMRLVPDLSSIVSADSAYGYGLSAPDANGDGIQDVFVANFDAGNSLYLGTSDGRFEAMAPSSIPQSAASKGHVWADFDLDGLIDLYLGSGTPAPDMVNRMWRGLEGGGFVPDSVGPHVADGDTSAAVAGADVDGDGDVDLFVANWGSEGSLDRLYLNQNAAGHWVAFRLEGESPNTGGVGAKVSIRISSESGARWLHRWATLSTGYAGQNEERIHFGIGEATAVDSVVVRWASGTVTAAGAMSAGETHQLAERSH